MGVALGFACAAVSIVCFGSNFIVTKRYKSGDGLFFQWVMATSILFSGAILWLIQCSVGEQSVSVTVGGNTYTGTRQVCPQFEPIAMLGGVVWACGNIFVVPIVKTIGLGLGLCIWGSANLLMGWASGRFGLFGIKAQPVSEGNLNYAGVLIAVAAMVVFLFIKPTLTKVGAKSGGDGLAGEGDGLDDALLVAGMGGGTSGIDVDAEKAAAGGGGAGGDGEEEVSWTDKLTAPQKKIFGVGASVLSGCLYGANFNPPQYVVDHAGTTFPGASANPMDYVFMHFVGIWVTATAFLLIYCAARRNAPVVFPEIILPGFISGTVWSIAQICWFIANANLSFVISFPLISVGPGMVGALWGALVFGEIKGKRNYALLVVAFVLVISSAAVITMSK